MTGFSEFASALRNTTGVVTGAGGALGREITAALTGAGMHVVGVDRESESLSALRDEYPSSRFTGVQADLLTKDWGGRVEDAVQGAGGPLTVWINNAGIAGHGSSASIEDAFWDRIMTVNVHAVLKGCQIAHGLMAPSGNGSIINVSSLVAKKVLTGRAAYGTSKVAVEGLTRYLAAEWGASGIRVNAIAPGFILTPISHLAGASQATLEATIGGIPMRRLGSPADIASVALMLASPATRYMTGAVLRVDGGWNLV